LELGRFLSQNGTISIATDYIIFTILCRELESLELIAHCKLH